jgi:hypothetical protein
LDEGEGLLREVLGEAEAAIDEGLSALYLAVCDKRQGRLQEGTRLARHAKLVLQERWVLQRIAEDFPEVCHRWP